MKSTHMMLAGLTAAALSLALLTGCSPAGDTPGASDTPSASATAPAFSFSDGIDDNGFWKGVRALDYLTDFQYEGLLVPAENHQVGDEAVQSEIDSLLSNFTTASPVTDRPIQDGDTVNIDYVGSIDGVEFEGGTTNGQGTDVIIGQTNYIDDFIQQLVGHNTGDAFDITVTFPEDYGKAELNGRDAVFAITINAISVSVTPEFTDAFVAEQLSASYGWNTAADARASIRTNLTNDAILNYLQGQLAASTVTEIPDPLMDYQEKALVKSYENSAAQQGVTLEEMLQNYAGVATAEELIANAEADLRSGATFALAVQAVAEDAGLSVTEADLTAYFEKNYGSADYSSYAAQTGLPYVKQVVLWTKALDVVVAKAVLG